MNAGLIQLSIGIRDDFVIHPFNQSVHTIELQCWNRTKTLKDSLVLAKLMQKISFLPLFKNMQIYADTVQSLEFSRRPHVRFSV